jgi:hypothetical protein
MTNPEPVVVSVFDDRHCIGHVLRRGPRGYEAFDSHDVSLGIYPTKGEAAAALTTIGVKGAAQ